MKKNPAYRGYLVTLSRYGAEISKGGFHIAWAKDEEDAKGIIRSLTDTGPRNNPGKRRKGMRFLVNPGQTRDNKGGGMAKRKTPPRYKSGPKKGQFMPKGARRKARRNPVSVKAGARRSATRAAPAPRVRAYRARRNPPKLDILDTMTAGALGAGGVLVGKAAARSLPQLLSLPQAGNVGLAVQAATAVVVGWLAERFIGRDVGAMMLAGGLSAPMESLVIRLNVPWLSPALASSGTVSGYANRPGGRVVVYRGGPPTVKGYVTPGAGAGPSGIAGYGYYA